MYLLIFLFAFLCCCFFSLDLFSVSLFFGILVGCFCGGFCGVSRRLLGVSGIFVGLAASAALRAFYNVFAAWCCGWWCPASRRGVGADPRRLVALSGVALRWIVSAAGRGSWASVWRCDGLRGWWWARVLFSFRGAAVGLCGLPGLSGGIKKPGLMLRLFV